MLFTLIALAGSTGWVAAAAAAPWDPFFAAPVTIAEFGAATRPFGVAAGDFDGDGRVDVVVGRTTGNVAFLKGNGDGTFQPPATFGWKQAFFNAWAFTAADVNNDGRLDVVWGANASSPSAAPFSVNDGEVRVFYGNGDGTFAESAYFVSGVRHNAGTLLADVGTDAGSLSAGDVDGDGDADVVVGAVDGSNTAIRLLRNFGGGLFTVETVVIQPAVSSVSSPIYFPATTTQNSPWGLSLSDADGDGDTDLWVGDRALYVYLFVNDGSGTFSLRTDNDAVPGRPNVYLGHDVFRAAVGFTPALGSGDINGDNIADLVLGLHSGTQTPSSGTVNDGSILLDVSAAAGHSGFGAVADAGTMARGITVADVNGDSFADILAAGYDGALVLLRQLPPIDSDTDGTSDYVDNAPDAANAPRIDLNTDGSVNHRDQLDNDGDTVLGDPEQPATWQRLGDPADPDDDNDGVEDAADNCPFVANADQADADGDAFGAACDPVDGGDADADGLPDGPLPEHESYARTLAAKIKWGSGTTRFVIRVDALGRFFQNEFTQIMTDAATLSPADWSAKCWENYEPDDVPGYQPCGTDEGGTRTLTLAGGKEVPVTLVVIPKQLWTDPPVVTWINDRNDNPLFELGQHGTYHFSNTMLGDWKDLADRNFFSCETCGLTEAESFELLKVGQDTLLGNYANPWILQSGAQADSPRIDWSSSAYPLLSYAPPFNASDTTSREATAQLGYKGFSASIFEEAGAFAGIFSPEGSHHEQFDQFGMFHASADVELEPPDTTGDTYDPAAYEAYLHSQTDQGGLTTWLIEEVEWSGRPCNNDDRLGTCNGASNRENNTVYLPRWNAWMQLLDFVKAYPGGVALTMGEVALAQAYDNAPTVANPDQADGDADGVGDIIEGAVIAADPAQLTRNLAGSIAATLRNGAGEPLDGQTLSFGFDEDGDGTEETFTATTDASGAASAAVMPTRPVGESAFSVSWNGVRLTAEAAGTAVVGDVSRLVLDPATPAGGQTTDTVAVAATLLDSSDAPVAGRTLTFTIGAATGSGITDASGRASVTLVLAGPAANIELQASFAGDDLYAPAAAAAPFAILREDTVLSLEDAVAHRSEPATAVATLREADGAPLAGKPVGFYVEDRVRGDAVRTLIGTATTDAEGRATLIVPSRFATAAVRRPIEAAFEPDEAFVGASAAAFAYRQ